MTGDAGEDDPSQRRRVAVFAQVRDPSQGNGGSKSRVPRGPQRYVNGSECDLTGQQREVTVRMVCKRGTKPQILSVQEHGTCRYRMVVGIPRLCAHPDFEVRGDGLAPRRRVWGSGV